jgi:succinyl-diaminopimelate desuccinylase
MIDHMQEGKNLIDVLAKLVSYESVDGKNDQTTALFGYLYDYLDQKGLNTELIHRNGTPSIFASTQSTKTPKVILQAHMDVVPDRPENFTMTEYEGKVYGRGVFDMKFAAACYLTLIDELGDSLRDYDFGLMLTSDEEIGGEDGVGYLLEEGYGGEVCLLPDGGDDWQIEASCNGVWIIRLVANGTSAHGSRPWEGDNAIDKLIDAIAEIKGLFKEIRRGESSITASTISATGAVNQVPDRAEATLDIRFKSLDESDAYQGAISLIIENRGLELDVVAESPCGLLDLQNEHVINFMHVAGRFLGHPIEKNHSLGASDARYFAAHNIPTIIIRPPGGGHHGSGEWIDKAGLLKFHELIKEYVTTVAKNA